MSVSDKERIIKTMIDYRNSGRHIPADVKTFDSSYLPNLTANPQPLGILPALEYINQLRCPIVFPYYGSVPVHLSYTSTQFRRGVTLLEKILLYWET